VSVNKLSSTRTQLPYDFYRLPYCRPPSVQHKAENLGEVLRGDRIQSSPYSFTFQRPARCALLCPPVTLDEAGAKLFADAVRGEYRAYIVLDNLPVAVPSPRAPDPDAPPDAPPAVSLERGVPVGALADGDDGSGDAASAPPPLIYNHLSFVVKHHPDPDTGLSRIVGFEVTPASVAHRVEADGSVSKATCDPTAASPVPPTAQPALARAGESIAFTYDVTYVESPQAWATRWDPLLAPTGGAVGGGGGVHWFALTNSAAVALFLAAMVALIMARTLRNDISAYNALDAAAGADGDGGDEAGWKLLHGDVFRPPPAPAALAVAVGTGAQIGAAGLVTLVAAAAGFLSPANRGGLATALALLFVACGVVGGHASARTYKAARGTAWKSTTMATALAFPAAVGGVGVVLWAVAAARGSTRAAPPSTVLALFALWLAVALPLTFAGALAGYRAPTPDPPCRVNRIPRQVPPQPLYLAPPLTAALGGLLPFGAVFIELFFAMTSIWQDRFYYLFGFLLLAAAVLAITSAEIAVVLTYFALASEDYRWWWRAFAAPAASGGYVLLYAAYYFFTRMDTVGVEAALLFFGYNALVAAAFAAVTGAVGFAASHAFVRTIYSAVKID
jgi:transmembrane 9 superfamily protein 2/4